MLDIKRRIFRIVENQINEQHLDPIQEMYGKGAVIKINSMNESIKTKSVLVEAVVVLGDTINEDVMDSKLAEVLIQDIMIYLFPRHTIQTYVSFDV